MNKKLNKRGILKNTLFISSTYNNGKNCSCCTSDFIVVKGAVLRRLDYDLRYCLKLLVAKHQAKTEEYGNE